jgi:transposase
MAKSKFIQHDTIKSLKKKQKEKTYAKIRDRLRGVIMISKGRTYQEIADTLGYSIQWVRKLSGDYTRGGLEGLEKKPYKGSEGFLSPDQLMEFYSIVLEGPSEEELLSRYRISDLREIVKKKWGIEYSVGGMHVLLKRMRLSHVTTRPQNPKNDPATMDMWKKKRKVSSAKKRKITAALKSGSKTRPDTGRRA